MSEPVKIKNGSFEEEVLNSEKPVIVDFWADWCGPCKMIAPLLEEIAEEYEDQVKVCKVNVDQEQELASRFEVMSIPTLLYFEDGEQEAKVIGYQPKESLLKQFNLN